MKRSLLCASLITLSFYHPLSVAQEQGLLPAEQAALTPHQASMVFGADASMVKTALLSEAEMKNTVGGSHYILIDIGGTLYQINLPD
jgi:hypothetical protein